MNRISSNTFFHFTKIENLIGILENNFYPRYCIEDTWGKSDSLTKIAYPIVCFCDIPLSQISNHINIYGQYAIGLSREWGIRKKMNPIIYIQNKSTLLKRMLKILDHNYENACTLPIDQIIEDRDGLVYLMMYTKIYEGLQIRNSEEKKIRFYDEREWRFIPDITKIDDEELHIIPEMYTIDQLEKKNNFLKNYPLVFEPNDVKYIIINKEIERKYIIDKITNIKSKKNYSYDEIKILTSRIISVEQIVEDF